MGTLAEPNKGQGCTDILGDFFATQVVGVVTVEGVPHLHKLLFGIADEFCFFPQAQAVTLGTIQKTLVAGHGQAVGLVFVDPDNIIVDPHQIAVVSHAVPSNGGGNEVFSFEFGIFVSFLNVGIKDPCTFPINGTVGVFAVAL